MTNLRGTRVITEAEIKAATAGEAVVVDAGAIITPLAVDLAAALGIRIERAAGGTAATRYRIAVAADHGGYPAKELLKSFLAELGHEVKDLGTHSTEAVDYPDYAHLVATAVAKGSSDVGIIIDGAGIGSCMTANKVPGIRAAMCYDEASAKNSREHNGANVLTLGGKLPLERLQAIVRAWLATDLTEQRHRRRVAKIMAIEREYTR